MKISKKLWGKEIITLKSYPVQLKKTCYNKKHETKTHKKNTTHLESTKRNKTIHIIVNEMKTRPIKIYMAMERSGNVCQK